MDDVPPARLRRFGVAAVAATLALMVNLALWRWEQSVSFPLFFAAVLFAAWRGGLGPGLLATGLSALASLSLFIRPSPSFALDARTAVWLAEFIGVSLAACYLTTARVRSDRALRASETRYRLMLENVRDHAIFMTDVRGNITDWEIGAGRVLGYKEAEILGKHASIIFTPEDIRAGIVEQELEGARTKGMAEDERWHVRKDGSRFFATGIVNSVKDELGRLRGFIKVMRDITDRKHAEEALKQREEQFRAMFEIAAVGKAQADPTTGRFVRVNRMFEELTGFSASELMGMTFDDLTHPEDHDTDTALFRCMRTDDGQYQAEKRYVRKDGTVICVLVNTTVLRGPTGKPSRTHAVFVDITDRKRAEAELAAALSREREARREAESVGRAKDQFLAMLSHELRNPINPVLLTATAMLDDPKTPEEMRPTWEMIRQNIGLEARLIDDLLDVMRNLQGKMVCHRQVVDAHSLMRQTLDIVQSDADGKDIRLALRFEAEETHVSADPARLTQAFWNLIKNGVKFTPEGGTITIRTRNEGGRFIVEFEDTGIGIEPAALPKIFNAFEQAEDAVTQKFGGLGLGLAITKAVVEAHGGHISASSLGKGRGSTFTIEIPNVSPAITTEGPAGASAEDSSEGRNLNILLVEDDPMTCRVMGTLLRNVGHSVTTAGSCGAALDLASRDFDLVVSDLGLPDCSGHELMSQLRKRYGLKGVALTGYGMEEDIRKSRDAGFVAHLTKPVDFSTLNTLIRRLAQDVRKPA